MGQQVRIRQVPETGGVVRHDVGGARDVVGGAAVAEMALVEAGQSQEVSGRPAGGAGPFAQPRCGGGVVPKVAGCSVANVEVLGKHVGVSEATGKFQVTVGDSAMGVAERDEVLLHRRGKPRAPEDWRVAIDKPDTTHALTRGIVGTDGGGNFGCYLGQVRGALVELLA